MSTATLRRNQAGETCGVGTGISGGQWTGITNSINFLPSDRQYSDRYVRQLHTKHLNLVSGKLALMRDSWGGHKVSVRRAGDTTEVVLVNSLTGREMTLPVETYVDGKIANGQRPANDIGADIQTAVRRLVDDADQLGWPRELPRKWDYRGTTFCEQSPESLKDVGAISARFPRPLTAEEAARVGKLLRYRVRSAQTVGDTIYRPDSNTVAIRVDFSEVNPRNGDAASLRSIRRQIERNLVAGVHPKQHEDGTYVRRPETRGQVFLDAIENARGLRVDFGQDTP